MLKSSLYNLVKKRKQNFTFHLRNKNLWHKPGLCLYNTIQNKTGVHHLDTSSFQTKREHVQHLIILRWNKRPAGCICPLIKNRKSRVSISHSQRVKYFIWLQEERYEHAQLPMIWLNQMLQHFLYLQKLQLQLEIRFRQRVRWNCKPTETVWMGLHLSD